MNASGSGTALPSPSSQPEPPTTTSPLLLGREPGLGETVATSPVWQGSDSSSPRAPKIESYFSFQLLRGEAQSAMRGCLAAEGMHQPPPLPHPARHGQAVPLGGPLLPPANFSLSRAPKALP